VVEIQMKNKRDNLKKKSRKKSMGSVKKLDEIANKAVLFFRNERIGVFTVRFLLFLIITFGLYWRIQPIENWNKEGSNRVLFDQPILLNVDGYFYLNLARDLLENTYDPVDLNRNVPEGLPRPFPPPLLSYITYIIAKWTPFSLDWIALILPAVLGVIIAFPIFALGKHYGGSLIGLISAFLSLIVYGYYYRSSIGWYDTDVLNVTFICCAAYFSIKFGKHRGWGRYLFFLFGAINFVLFLLWWDQAPVVVTITALGPFAIALLVYYRPAKREGLIFFGFLFLCFVFFLTFFGMDSLFDFFSKIGGYWKYIEKQSVDYIPQASMYVMEQVKPSFKQILQHTTGNIFVFLFVALPGLIGLFYFHKKDSLFIIMLALLSAFSFSAIRFSIYLSVFLSLSIGFFFWLVWRFGQRSNFLLIALLALLVMVSWNPLQVTNDLPYRTVSIVSSVHRMVFDEFHKKLPSNAVIWTNWTFGYPIRYYARLGIVGDGSNHGGKLLLATTLPLTTTSWRQSANFMKFYIKNGMHFIDCFSELLNEFGNDWFYHYNEFINLLDLKARSSAKILDTWPTSYELITNILADSPTDSKDRFKETYPQATEDDMDKWLSLFYPEEYRPTYLFMDYKMFYATTFLMQDWDFDLQKGKPLYFNVIWNTKKRGDFIIAESKYSRGKQKVKVNLKEGIATVGKKSFYLTHFCWNDGTKLHEHAYNRTSGLRFEMNLPRKYGAFVDEETSKTLFNKILFNQIMTRETYRSSFFEFKGFVKPMFQIYRVKGDVYVGS
jgi:hypothetical protein